MSKIDKECVLSLNRVWMPIDIVSPRDAFRLMIKESARAMGPDYFLYKFEEWVELAVNTGDIVNTTRIEVPIPQIIVQSYYDDIPIKVVTYSKRNVWIRDGMKCGYCLKDLDLDEVHIDHIHPKCKGGPKDWLNTITACKECNHSKRDAFLEDISDTHILQIKPRNPVATSPMFKIKASHKGEIPEMWKKFLW